MVRPVKQEPGRNEAAACRPPRPRRATAETDAGESSSPPNEHGAAKQGVPRPQRQAEESSGQEMEQGVTERRVLRSRYLAVKSLISDEQDDIGKSDSERFRSIFTEVESLHQMVQKPREQVADAEALLDIASTLMTSVKSQSNNGVTPSDFVTALLRNFGQDGRVNNDNATNVFPWSDLGLAVPDVFRKTPGCMTMIGPMNSEIKQRKTVIHKKRTKPTERSRPEELDSEQEVQTDTDRNMSTMFNILRKNKRVRLENLVLNRASFAQTVENVFALSFLVKDGRAEISVNNSRHHFVSPKNAPAARSVASNDVSYDHFVFRFDFKDWKVMINTVRPGEELMPDRSHSNTCGSAEPDRTGGSAEPDPTGGSAEPDPTGGDRESAAPTTPIRKLTRNRGLVIQEQSVVDDTPDRDSDRQASLKQKGKRLYGS